MDFRELVLTLLLLVLPILADPEINLLQAGCSSVKSNNVKVFQQNLNASLASVVQAVASSGFATDEEITGSDPVYMLAQCREDKNSSDCVECIRAAEKQIRNCSNVSGGRTIYDGCFLRYESNNFYTQSTADGNSQLCGNHSITSTGADSFSATSKSLLSDLCTATPKTSNFFGAQSRKDASNVTIYGLAWCLKSVSKEGCANCLSIAQTNIASCLGRSEGRAVDAGCSLRYATYSFFSDDATTDLAQFLSTGGKFSATVWIIIGVVGGVIFVAVLSSVFLFRREVLTYFRRPPQKQVNTETATELRGPVDFDYKILRKATDNFSAENKIGEGGFGQVYKGTLKNGKVIAVKKLTLNQSPRAILEFESEVKLVSNVHHRNLVRLLGCCNQGPEKLLVYEYMSNSSLDRILFHGQSEKILSWKERFDIILGTARGLAYLHEDFHVCIIHRDIKCSNILLDDDLQPKIADFGLARLLPDDRSHLTTRIAGTLGYTAPEYAIHTLLKSPQTPQPCSHRPSIFRSFFRAFLREDSQHMTSWHSQKRIHSFSSTEDVDPSLHPSFAESLKKACPAGSTQKNAGALLDSTATRFDNQYYKDVLAGKGLFSSDAALYTDEGTKQVAHQYAASRLLFYRDFVKSMVKMSNIPGQGSEEVRLNCRKFN